MSKQSKLLKKNKVELQLQFDLLSSLEEANQKINITQLKIQLIPTPVLQIRSHE
jgi:hypothetical protein